MADEDHNERAHLAGLLFGHLIDDPDTKDRRAAEGDDLRNRMYDALRTMTGEQLLMVRHMLNSGARDGYAQQWFDGIVSTVMFMHLGIDPDTAKSPEEQLLETPAPPKE